MPNNDAGWDIYAEQMLRAQHGIALWDPCPTDSYKRVKRGYVGYVIRGCFELLFDANGPLGDRVLGQDVPDDFEPLPQEADFVRRRLRPPADLFLESKKSIGITAEASTSLAPVDGGFTYSSSSSRGAVLITQDWITAEDAVRERAYERYIKKHYRSWLRFADSQGFNVDLKDLILVTGHDMTREFAMAAFSDNSRMLRMSFRAGVQGTAMASVSAWGSWETSPLVHRNCGPPGSSFRAPRTPDLDPGQDDYLTSVDELSHCIFLRGFRIRARRFLFPGSIRAAAGPSNLPGDDGSRVEPPVPCDLGCSDEDSMSHFEGNCALTEEVPYSSTPAFVDPLEPLFEYIFQSSSSSYAIVHDFDLQKLLNSLSPLEETEDVTKLLMEMSPHVGIDEDGVGRIMIDTEATPRAFIIDVDAPAQLQRQYQMKTTGEGQQVFEGLAASLPTEHIEARRNPIKTAKSPIQSESERVVPVTIQTVQTEHWHESGKETHAHAPVTNGIVQRRRCMRCQGLKVRCEYYEGQDACRRCARGGHDCVDVMTTSESRTAKQTLLAQLRDQTGQLQEMLDKLMQAQRISNAPPNTQSSVDGDSEWDQTTRVSMPPGTSTRATSPDMDNYISLKDTHQQGPNIAAWIDEARASIATSEDLMYGTRYDDPWKDPYAETADDEVPELPVTTVDMGSTALISETLVTPEISPPFVVDPHSILGDSASITSHRHVLTGHERSEDQGKLPDECLVDEHSNETSSLQSRAIITCQTIQPPQIGHFTHENTMSSLAARDSRPVMYGPIQDASEDQRFQDADIKGSKDEKSGDSRSDGHPRMSACSRCISLKVKCEYDSTEALDNALYHLQTNLSLNERIDGNTKNRELPESESSSEFDPPDTSMSSFVLARPLTQMGAVCKRCRNGGHDCKIPGRRRRARGTQQHSTFIEKIQKHSLQIAKLMKDIEIYNGCYAEPLRTAVASDDRSRMSAEGSTSPGPQLSDRYKPFGIEQRWRIAAISATKSSAALQVVQYPYPGCGKRFGGESFVERHYYLHHERTYIRGNDAIEAKTGRGGNKDALVPDYCIS